MFRNFKQTIKKLITEYRQVKWPSLKTTLNLALFVIVVSVIITAAVIGLDALFFKLRALFIIN